MHQHMQQFQHQIPLLGGLYFTVCADGVMSGSGGWPVV